MALTFNSLTRPLQNGFTTLLWLRLTPSTCTQRTNTNNDKIKSKLLLSLDSLPNTLPMIATKHRSTHSLSLSFSSLYIPNGRPFLLSIHPRRNSHHLQTDIHNTPSSNRNNSIRISVNITTPAPSSSSSYCNHLVSLAMSDWGLFSTSDLHNHTFILFASFTVMSFALNQGRLPTSNRI